MSLGIVTEKAVSFKSSRDIWNWFIPVRRRIVKGYKTWKRYEKFFPLKQFEIFYESFAPSREFPKNPMVILIHKERFRNCVTKYRDDFEQILGKKVTGDDLLKEGKERAFVAEVLQNHDALVGTLLGYGRNNGFLFHQLTQLQAEQWETFCEENHFFSVWTDEEFTSFNKQFKQSVSWVSFFITGSYLKDLKLMTLPGFRAIWGSEETEYWRKHYLETKQAVINYYQDKDFLETTLTVLTR